ncbi:MAG TPA: GAF domain-containing SpoIIE family protein phosphatase [Chthoniobacterales bacterium]|nr:GAF domain-containing SpoIIE family protein phosphatase [Chthoniobacterales bacterium]
MAVYWLLNKLCIASHYYFALGSFSSDPSSEGGGSEHLFSVFEIYFVGVPFLVLSCVLAGLLWKQRRRVKQLKRSRFEIKQEENRVFDFLHGLGEAFSGSLRSHELHRLIVEGAMRILEASGGALYLLDQEEKTLIPAFLSEHASSFVIIPEFIRKPAPALRSLYGVVRNPSTSIKSFLKLHGISRHEGILGDAWGWSEPRFVSNKDLPSELVEQGLDTVLLGPLIYRNRTVGVLALGNSPLNSFSSGGVEVFRIIAEQSAFALYNRAIYKEAGEKRLLDRDLEIAREIQKLLLPSDSPKMPGYEVCGVNIPARALSGDYFDYLTIDENHVGIAIADVSGKGVPASLIMAMCRSALRSQAAGHFSPSQVLHRVNRQLYPDMKEDMFISMAYVTIDQRTNEAQLARAGHDAPLFYRAAQGTIERLKPKGMAVGIDSGEVFDRFCNDFAFHFEQGDCLLLYTDGVTEALNVDGFEFGVERLMQCLKESATQSSSNILKYLTNALRIFVAHQPQHDDITLIAIRKL